MRFSRLIAVIATVAALNAHTDIEDEAASDVKLFARIMNARAQRGAQCAGEAG